MEKSMLDPVEHERLIADMPDVLSTANLPERFLHESMTVYCKDVEVDWVRNFHAYRKAKAGMILEGISDPENRCMAICGALVRNFIDARIVYLNTVIAAMQKDEVPDPTVLILPTLYVKTHGKSFTSWQIQGLHDLLSSRYTASKPTVMYVQSMADLESSFGVVFSDHLKTNYVLVK